MECIYARSVSGIRADGLKGEGRDAMFEQAESSGIGDGVGVVDRGRFPRTNGDLGCETVPDRSPVRPEYHQWRQTNSWRR